jgi:hypothetical protein
MRRVIQRIYDDLNAVIQAINASALPRDTQGKTGDIRVTENANGEAVINVRTKDGWSETTPLTRSTDRKE